MNPRTPPSPGGLKLLFRAVLKQCGLCVQILWFRVDRRRIRVKKSIQMQEHRDSYGRRLSQTQFLSWNRNYQKLGFSNNQWRIQGGPARLPHHIFLPNLGPNFFFWRPASSPLLYLRVRRTGSLPYLKVWIYRALHDLRLLLLIFSFSVYFCLVSCSSRCVPACVCCLYWWDSKKLPSPTKQL